MDDTMLTILYLYYNQPQAITHLEKIGAPNHKVNYLFVDDASTPPLQLNWKNAKVIRINKNTPWNQPMANNFGFSYLYAANPESIVLRMDMDHYVTKNQIDELIEVSNSIKNRQIIKFKRTNNTSHPNIYMAFVKDLLKAGGYNLDFCGNYGYDDRELMHRLKKLKFLFQLNNLQISTNHKPGSHGLKRDTTINHQKYLKAIQ